jgi:hypothetical protein
MNEHDADAIAKRIINTWHSGPRLTEWVEVLAGLDAGTAGTAYIRCRNELEHAPSIAKFIAVYRSLHTATTHPVDRPTCGACDGTGFVDAPNLTTPDGRSYTQVDRCPHCTNGRPLRQQRDEPLAQDHPRALAAFARGVAQGAAELDALRNQQPPQHRRPA